MAKKPSSPSTEATIRLDAKFWSDFSRKNWEKKSLVVKNVKSPLIEMGEEAIFDLLVKYSDHCRKRKEAEGFKFYISGEKAYAEDVLQVLPIRKDKSLLGYHARMNKMFSDYCLVCDELLKSNSEKQSLLANFTADLYQAVGFPNRFSEMGLYLGNYRKTPFGVHVDQCGVFSFPVVGTKKFRLWSPEFVRKNPTLDRAFKYEKFKKDSELLTVQTGGMSYWPSSDWHIAESDGSFSATWSLGVWVDKTHQVAFTESLSELLKLKMGKEGQAAMTAFKTLSTDTGQISEMPDAFSKSIQALKKLSTAELEETFLTAWMKHISSQGFKNLPQQRLKMTPNLRIQKTSDRSRILWQKSQLDSAKIFISFGGILLNSTQNSGLHKLIQALNAGEVCQVKDFIKSSSKNDIAILQRLADAGAFATA